MKRMLLGVIFTVSFLYLITHGWYDNPLLQTIMLIAASVTSIPLFSPLISRYEDMI